MENGKRYFKLQVSIRIASMLMYNFTYTHTISHTLRLYLYHFIYKLRILKHLPPYTIHSLQKTSWMPKEINQVMNKIEQRVEEWRERK